MDLISNLPDPIVHHIMSFLTISDVTKLSILCKRFFFLWGSFPVIEFEQSRVAQTYQGTRASITNGFLDHVLNSVLLRRISLNVSEFRVSANLTGISADRRLDLAILTVLQNRVTSMELNLGFAKYMLPTEFASKSLTVLRLKGLRLDLCNLIQVCPSLKTVSLTSCVVLQDIKFSSKSLTEIELYSCGVKYIKINAPNLRLFHFLASKKDSKPCHIDVLQCQNIMNLSLKNVVNGRHWIEEHVYALSKLKTFILNGCQDIEHISVRNDKLERVVICHCLELTSIEVKATSLETFMFETAHQGNACNITFFTSKCIKDLSITGAALITDQWLEAQLAKMNCLERLKLKVCNSLKKIKVSHEKLQILELYSCHGLVEEADIDTPQLISFMYQGHMIEFAKVVTHSNCTTTLSMNPWITYDNASFYKWREMLSFFGHCKSLKLICSTHKEVSIPAKYRERLVSPLYDLPHLDVQIKSLEKIDRDLVDSLLWLSPLPKTLHISSGRSRLQTVLKFVYSNLIEEEEDKIPSCCATKPIKCWKHHLESLEIESGNVSPKNGSSELQKYFLSYANQIFLVSTLK